MPQKQKLKMEEKVKIVIKYIAGEVSISGAATEAGADRKTHFKGGSCSTKQRAQRPSCRAGGSTYTVRN